MEIYTKMFWTTLFVGVLCGIVSVLIDLDHVIAFIHKRDCHNARLLHKPLFVIAGIVFFSIITYIGGLVC